MAEEPVAGRGILSPQVWVYVGRSDRWARYPTLSIVDTGSPVTIIESRIVEALGISSEEIVAGDEQRFSGIGGDGGVTGRSLTLDLAVVPDQKDKPERGLRLRASRVFVAEKLNGIILGQHDFLERLRFEQRNYPPDRDFDLQPVDLD